jgi:hypothetical protein
MSRLELFQGRVRLHIIAQRHDERNVISDCESEKTKERIT